METILVLDFGGQYNQLIARRVRECNVYCEVKPYTTPLEELKAMQPKGFIFTGGPNSVYDATSPKVDPAHLHAGRAGPRHLLRLPAHGPDARRRGHGCAGQHGPRIRPARRRYFVPLPACSRACPSRASPG